MPAGSRWQEPCCGTKKESKSNSALPADKLPSPAYLVHSDIFFSVSHTETLFEYLPHTCTLLQASSGRCLYTTAVQHRSHGGPSSFLVKEPIQVNSDSIFPPLLDKQNREMPLTRKRSSNHLVFASRSLPVTVETTPLPPTCCQCLDCSYLLLIELASPYCFFLILYKAATFCKHLAGVTKSDGEIIISTASLTLVPNWPSKHRRL